MTAFSSPEVLAEHYEKKHGDAAGDDDSLHESSLQAEAEFQARREVMELQSALAVSMSWNNFISYQHSFTHTYFATGRENSFQ
jgi:hypothetical protein